MTINGLLLPTAIDTSAAALKSPYTSSGHPSPPIEDSAMAVDCLMGLASAKVNSIGTVPTSASTVIVTSNR